MNNKILLGLSIIFVVLLAIVAKPYWSQYLELPGMKAANDEKLIKVPTNLSKITFATNTEQGPVTLNRVDQNWYVNDKLVDVEQINSLLEDLNNLQIDSVVSTNPDNFITYDATESSPYVVLENDDSEKTQLIIGNASPQFGTIYLRPADSEEVYLVESILRQNVAKSVEQWRDKTIVSLSQSEIEQISVTRDSRTIEITPTDDGSWQAIKGSDSRLIGEVAKDRLFETIASLKGNYFADEDQTKIFNQKNRPVTVDFVTKDQELNEVLTMVEDKTDSIWLIQKNSDEEIYTLPLSVGNILIESSFTLFE